MSLSPSTVATSPSFKNFPVLLSAMRTPTGDQENLYPSALSDACLPLAGSTRTYAAAYSWLRETTTVAVKALNFATRLVNLIDGLDRPKMVNTGV
jgi:hypothetical protein